MIYLDIWSSLIVFARGMLDELQIRNPEVPIQIIDWEAHGNIHELPDADLIGPTALTLTEQDPQVLSVTFAIAISTYASDRNLFRQRLAVAHAFERMRPMRRLEIWSSDTARPIGTLTFTDGTLISPMSKAEPRPWQYVQAQGYLEPTLAP